MREDEICRKRPRWLREFRERNSLFVHDNGMCKACVLLYCLEEMRVYRIRRKFSMKKKEMPVVQHFFFDSIYVVYTKCRISIKSNQARP